MVEGDLSIHNPNLSPERKKLLIEIHEEILRKYREANIPMIFKLPGCSASQWWSYNLNSGEYRKVQVSIDDEIECFIYIDEN